MPKLLTSFVQHSTDASFSGFAGGLFTFTGPNGSIADQLGLFKCTGNTTLTVYLCSFVAGTVTVLASVAINVTASTVGSFTYANITPVTLTHGAQYILYVAPAGQNFAGDDSNITMNGGTPVSAGLGLSGVTGTYTPENTGAFQYGGIDMIYNSSAPTGMLFNTQF